MDNWVAGLVLGICVALWFTYKVLRLWLNYRARKDALELCRAFVTQGKELPADLIESIRREQPSSAGNFFGGDPVWGRVVLFTSLALGAAYEALFAQPDGRTDQDVLAAAVILAALAIGSVLIARFSSKSHDSP
jgi:hypothetical protein